MSAFRLQTFSPANGRASATREPTDLERRIAAEREAAYREGFVAGQGVATDAHLEDQGRLTAELLEALDDARLTNDAARRHVAGGLAPALRALAAVIAPALAAAGLGAEIEAIVARAVGSAPDAHPRIQCAPETAPHLRAIFSGRGILAEVVEAPEMLPREARIHWDHGFDRIDLDACAAEALACISAHVGQLPQINAPAVAAPDCAPQTISEEPADDHLRSA